MAVYKNCKKVVLDCEDFHQRPFAKHSPSSLTYKWWYLPRCGDPDYNTLFKDAPNKKYCMDVVRGQKPYNALRFRDTCTENKLVSKYKPKKNNRCGPGSFLFGSRKPRQRSFISHYLNTTKTSNNRLIAGTDSSF